MYAKFIRKILFFSFLFLFICGCESRKTQIMGYWHINEVFYHNELVIYDLPASFFSLNKDYTCELPTRYEERNSNKNIGSWSVYTKDKVTYLNVDSENALFNRTYKLESFGKIQDKETKGYLLEMVLVSDSLKMVCWRQYNGN